MRERLLAIILSNTICLILLCNSGYAQPKVKDLAYGKVVGITDGDTFTLLIQGNVQQKVRLHGIDCPEKSQPFGQAAKKQLSDLIYSKSVMIKRTDKDRYGRTIALVYDANNRCINEEMIKTGYAWHYVRYDTNKAWNDIEKEARNAHRGLWKDAHSVPPWEWRR